MPVMVRAVISGKNGPLRSRADRGGVLRILRFWKAAAVEGWFTD
jgi:hypothetical protein